MIYENNCLFLFEKDLMIDFRGISSDQADLRMFRPKEALEDNSRYTKMLKLAHMIIYVDVNRREIMHLSGPKKGRVETY